MDDVVICQHEAVRCKDDAGAGTRVAAVHVDHGWTDGFDRADDRLRVGVQQLVIVNTRFSVHAGIVGVSAAVQITQMG